MTQRWASHLCSFVTLLLIGCGTPLSLPPGLGWDGEPPEVDLHLSARLGSCPTQVELELTADINGSGIFTYSLYRDGEFLDMANSPSGLVSDPPPGSKSMPAEQTRYCYRAYADERNYNRVGSSNTVCITTGVQKEPTAPENLTISGTSYQSISLAWTAAQDDCGYLTYDLYRDGSLYESLISGTSFEDNGLEQQEYHCYSVVTVDTAGNISEPSPEVCGSSALDDTPPDSMVAPSLASQGSDVMTVSWGAASDLNGIGHYNLFRDGVLITTVEELYYVDEKLEEDTRYCYSLTAVDMPGNESPPGEERCALTSWLVSTPYNGILAGGISLDVTSAGIPYLAIIGTRDPIPPSEPRQLLSLIWRDEYRPVWNMEDIYGYHTTVKPVVALDGNDTANLLYVTNDSEPDLMHLYGPEGGYSWSGSEWVDRDVFLGTAENLSIVSGPSAHLHASYHAEGGGVLKYAHFRGGTSWNRYTVSDQSDESVGSYITTAHNGIVHMAYVDSVDGNVVVATKVVEWPYGFDWWDPEVVTQVGTSPDWVALAVDDAGTRHLLVGNQSGGTIRYAEDSGGAWASELIEEGFLGGGGISAHPDGTVRIVYANENSGELKYLRGLLGHWQTIVLAIGDGMTTPTNPVLVVDNAGRSHLAYSENRLRLRYMKRF